MKERRKIRALLMAVLLFAGSATAAEEQKAIPAQFHGEWNSNLEHCSTGLNDSQLRIGAERIQFHESDGAVHSVETQGEFDLEVIAELSGEGETWLSYRHFRLSADRNSLTDVTDDGSDFVRYRCPNSSE